MPRPIDISRTFEWELLPTLELVIEYKASVYPGDPGRTYGPPEKCYPPEPPEVTFKGIKVTGFYYKQSFFSLTTPVLLKPSDINDPLEGWLTDDALEALHDHVEGDY